MQIDMQYLSEKSDFALQFNIEGEGSGIFYVEYKDKKLETQPYDYHDCTACIKGTSDMLIKLVKGKAKVNDEGIEIDCRTNDAFKKVIDFFEICARSHKEFKCGYKKNDTSCVMNSTNPWENLRVYIENADIDLESKNQLLANLVKFTSNELHILIVGACGCGKSSTINALFNMDIAEVGYGVDPQTQKVSEYKLDNLYLHDTPGLGESPKKDMEHIKKIKTALREVDSKGKPVIDVVLVIVDGSHRDMSASFKLINEVVIPNMQQKDRILIGINRCDLALDGRGWVEEYNYPDEELLQRLEEKTESVRRRIKEDTGVDVKPVFYSALHKYNISKLLSYLVKSAPIRKRVFFAEKINKNPEHFVRDDTVSLSRKSQIESHSNPELREEMKQIKTSVKKMGEKIEDIHGKITSQKADNKEIFSQKKMKDDYIIHEKQTTNYRDEFKNSMEEAFGEVSKEISRGSKHQIKLSFVNLLDEVKRGASKGAAAGREIGGNIPGIGATVGGALGVVIGSVGGLLTGIFGKKN